MWSSAEATIAPLDASPLAVQQGHKTFLDAYRRQQWDDAERALATCREIGVAQLETYYTLFAARIAELRHTSLPSNWDGSFVMAEK
jgi:adenylate cyclase